MNPKNITSLLILLLVVGCAKEPESVSNTSNPEFNVEKLFVHDGCTVYRFSNSWRDHYFARCRQETETIGSHSEPCGKGCITRRDENIRTEYF